jgi:hypothetical protein
LSIVTIGPLRNCVYRNLVIMCSDWQSPV